MVKKPKKVNAYGSETDSSDGDFVPKSMNKGKKDSDKPMSKRQMKKLGIQESSLSSMFDNKSLKQKVKMANLQRDLD